MPDEHPFTPVPVRPAQAPTRPSRAPSFPEDPDAARAEIEATRARMSETLDEIEEALLRKKEAVREKMDVMAPVRDDPVKTIAMIFGAALLLGFLSAGGKKKSRDNHHHVDLDADLERDAEEERLHEEAELAWSRAEAWEDRAHRLLRIANAQESELEIHRSRRDAFLKELRDLRRRARTSEVEEEEDDYEEEPNLFQRLRETATERLAGLANQVSYRMMRGS